jgi:hypothetical protein
MSTTKTIAAFKSGRSSCVPGVKYDARRLRLYYWIDASNNPVDVSANRHFLQYFTKDGVFMGPDGDGIQPVFRNDHLEVQNATWGWLFDLRDDDYIGRPATREEREASLLAGPRGPIRVDGRLAYVRDYH